MSMVCGLQAFDETDIERIRSGELALESSCYSRQSKSTYPLALYLIEIIGVLWIYAHASRMFPKYWYIWMLLPIGLIIHFYIETKRPLKKQKGMSPVPSANELWLDKAWHGIHFLLTGSAWEGDEPLNFLVTAGEPIEGTDSGYGEDRLFTSEQV